MLKSMIQDIIDQLTEAKSKKLIHSANVQTNIDTTSISIIVAESVTQTAIEVLCTYLKESLPNSSVYTNGRVVSLTARDQSKQTLQNVNI